MKNFYKQAWFISLVIAAVLSFLIAYAGPLVAIAGKVPLATLNSRLTVIMIIVFIWGLLNLLWNKSKSDKNADRSVEKVKSVTTTVPDALSYEHKAVATMYHNILDNLKSKKLSKNFDYKTLPYYLVIGDSGSGKTTLLANSNCFSPVSMDRNSHLDKESLPIQGVWANKDAIMFELASHFFSLEDIAEKSQLEYLLKLFKRARPRLPLNGLVLTVNANYLLKDNVPALQQRAKLMNNFINCVNGYLGVNLPVYVTFTHTDLILGFKEFFSSLDQTARESWWGIPLVGGDDIIKNFIVSYNNNINGLNSKVLPIVQRSYDPKHNTLVAYFPLQMASLKTAITKFLHTIFQAHHYETPCTVNGVYFSSAKQQGAPKDNLATFSPIESSRDLAVTTAASQRNNVYFIKDLFKKIIIPHADMAALNAPSLLRFRLKSGLIFAATLLISLLCIVTWYQSYQQYNTKVAYTGEVLNNFSNLKPYSLERLNTARSVAGLFDSEKWDLLKSLGLASSSRMSDGTEKFYQVQLQRIFLPYIVNILQDKIANNADNPQALYDSLKAYSMLYEPEHMDVNFLKKTISQYWQNQYSPALQAQLNAHLAALLAQPLPKLTANTALMEQARQRLNQTSPAQRIYWQLQQSANSQGKPALNLATSQDSHFLTVFSVDKTSFSIPWLYTAQGLQGFYEKYQHSLLKANDGDNWVLGNATTQSFTQQDVQQQMNELYAQAYTQQWQTLLTQVKIKPFDSLPVAVKRLALLAGPTSPMVQLLKLTADNTAYPVKKLVNPLKDSTADHQQVQNMIRSSFAPINTLSTPTVDSKATPVAAVLTSLSALHDYLQAITMAPNPDEAAFNAAKQLMAGNGDVFTVLKQQAAQMPEPLRSWLNDIADQSLALVFSGAKNYINTVWQNSVYADYQRNIANAYPFAAQAQQEVALPEFTRFFSPKGLFATFTQNYIQPFAVWNNNQWQAKQFLDHGIAFNSASLFVFQRANIITQVFFPNNSEQPGLQFSLKPVSLSNNALQSQLTVGSQVLTYRHDPQRFMAFSWPAPAIQGINLSFTGLDGTQAVVDIPWLWGWSKLVNEMGSRSITADNHAVITVSYQQFSASYEVMTNAVVDPFVVNVFAGFGMPGSF